MALFQESCEARFFNTSIDVIEPYVQTADCDVIETCAREIYTTRFMNVENELFNLVAEFNKSYSQAMNGKWSERLYFVKVKIDFVNFNEKIKAFLPSATAVAER